MQDARGLQEGGEQGDEDIEADDPEGYHGHGVLPEALPRVRPEGDGLDVLVELVDRVVDLIVEWT